jgi:hypothetical protein
VTLFERIEYVNKLWSMVCPMIEPPADKWLALWCTNYEQEVIEAGLARTGQKFGNEQLVDADRAHRYATSVLRRIATEGLWHYAPPPVSSEL